LAAKYGHVQQHERTKNTAIHGRRKDFFQVEGQQWIFPGGNGDISFYPLKPKKSTFFAKNLTE